MTLRDAPPGSLERVLTDPAVIERLAITLFGIHYNVDGRPARCEWRGLATDVQDLWRARATGALYEHLIDGLGAR